MNSWTNYDHIAGISLSVYNEANDHAILLYPNPANSIVTIEGFAKAFSVKILNSIGKVVLELRKVRNNQIDVSGLAPGVYQLVLISGQQEITRRISCI